MTAQDRSAEVDTVLQRATVEARVGLSRTTIWRLQRRGYFPLSVRLSPGRVGWLESEISAWLAERALARETSA